MAPRYWVPRFSVLRTTFIALALLNAFPVPLCAIKQFGSDMHRAISLSIFRDLQPLFNKKENTLTVPSNDHPLYPAIKSFFNASKTLENSFTSCSERLDPGVAIYLGNYITRKQLSHILALAQNNGLQKSDTIKQQLTTLPIETAIDIIRAADYLDIPELIEISAAHIVTQLHANTQVFDQYLRSLHKNLLSLIQPKFISLIASPTFHNSKTLSGHTDWVTSVNFSPDGNMLASASYDHTVKLWTSEQSILKTLTLEEIVDFAQKNGSEKMNFINNLLQLQKPKNATFFQKYKWPLYSIGGLTALACGYHYRNTLKSFFPDIVKKLAGN